MLAEQVSSILSKRKTLHPNDPTVEQYWQELTVLLSKDENATIALLDQSTADDISWLSEVFEDVSEQLQSKSFIHCIEKLSSKFPELELDEFIEEAKSFLE